MTLPIDFRRDVETATNAVYAAWPQFCQRARASFAVKQRGTLLVDLDQPIPDADDIPYFTTEEVPVALGLQDGVDMIAIMSRVGTYNPESELVVTFHSVQHKQAQCLVLRSPPPEFEGVPIVTDCPDPRAATTFEELLDILNDIYFRADVDAMDTASRHVWRVMEATWQIQSNGFYGYFGNVGPKCCELLTALDAIASPVLQKVFSSVFALFPDGKPSAAHNELNLQLSAIINADEDAFERHDSDFYGIDEQIPAILWAYWQEQRSKTA
jgi:hypothetical protein